MLSLASNADESSSSFGLSADLRPCPDSRRVLGLSVGSSTFGRGAAAAAPLGSCHRRNAPHSPFQGLDHPALENRDTTTVSDQLENGTVMLKSEETLRSDSLSSYGRARAGTAATQIRPKRRDVDPYAGVTDDSCQYSASEWK